MELKEIYIAPEIEILCFRPVELLANNFTGTWNWSGGTGEAGGGNEGTLESENVGQDSEYEGDTD